MALRIPTPSYGLQEAFLKTVMALKTLYLRYTSGRAQAQLMARGRVLAHSYWAEHILEFAEQTFSSTDLPKRRELVFGRDMLVD